MDLLLGDCNRSVILELLEGNLPRVHAPTLSLPVFARQARRSERVCCAGAHELVSTTSYLTALRTPVLIFLFLAVPLLSSPSLPPKALLVPQTTAQASRNSGEGKAYH